MFGFIIKRLPSSCRWSHRHTLTWLLILLAPGKLLQPTRRPCRPPSRPTSTPSTASTAHPQAVRPRDARHLRLRVRPTLDAAKQPVVNEKASPPITTPGTRPYLGYSLRYGASRSTYTLQTLPISAALGLSAYLLALVVGVTAGTLAALNRTRASTTPRWPWRCSHQYAQLRARADPRSSSSRCRSLLPPARWNGFPSWNVLLPF